MRGIFHLYSIQDLALVMLFKINYKNENRKIESLGSGRTDVGARPREKPGGTGVVPPRGMPN
jgi:hypothetical protein